MLGGSIDVNSSTRVTRRWVAGKSKTLPSPVSELPRWQHVAGAQTDAQLPWSQLSSGPGVANTLSILIVTVI